MEIDFVAHSKRSAPQNISVESVAHIKICATELRLYVGHIDICATEIHIYVAHIAICAT
jgi:hypothetical protein